MQDCTQGLKLCARGEHERTSGVRVALAEDVVGGGLVGVRHLRRVPAPVGAQLLRQGLVTLQVRLRGLRTQAHTSLSPYH